jgi:AraC-like DNA-binding protein
MFQAHSTTVARWIRSRRLDRVRQDLADPRYASIAVMDVARRWGFVEPSPFSRTFRAAYLMSPSEYRASRRSQVRNV